jgi:hypothetical protein
MDILSGPPPDVVLCLFVPRPFIEDFLDEEFLFAVDKYWFGGVEGTDGGNGVVVFLERGEFGCVEHWERVWCVREV